LVLEGDGELTLFDRFHHAFRDGERERQLVPRAPAWNSDSLRRQHGIRCIMPPETDVKLNRTLTRRGKKNSIVRALALDRQVDSLADAHLAPLESHQVEVLIGVCGVPPARLVAHAVLPV